MKYLSLLKNKILSNKICLLRVDFNIEADRRGLYAKNRSGLTWKIPLRIEAVLPTIRFLTERGAKVIILSHRGRPKISLKFKVPSSRFTLKPFAKILSKLLKKPVRFISFNFGTSGVPKLTSRLKTSDVLLLENLRFLPGEEKNDKKLAKRLASLGDFYINDAFSVSHRANASVAAITKFLPSYAGLLLEKEIKNLSALKKPKKPLIIVLGGTKISDKIGLIRNFLKKADYFLIGGGMANTFLAAKNMPVGDSLYEKEIIPTARRLLHSAGKKIILPSDTVIDKRKILDIGPETAKKYAEIIKKAKTIIWNGPMGYFENPKFAKGSIGIIKAILANKKAFAVIGGGETTSLLRSTRINADPDADKRGCISVNQRRNQRLSALLNQRKSAIFISTGGGAMLEYLAGKKLPGLEALKNSHYGKTNIIKRF